MPCFLINSTEEAMQNFEQSVDFYFNLSSNPAKRNPDRLLYDIKAVVFYAI